jgi:hypothetical protein
MALYDLYGYLVEAILLSQILVDTLHVDTVIISWTIQLLEMFSV